MDEDLLEMSWAYVGVPVITISNTVEVFKLIRTIKYVLHGSEDPSVVCVIFCIATMRASLAVN